MIGCKNSHNISEYNNNKILAVSRSRIDPNKGTFDWGWVGMLVVRNSCQVWSLTSWDFSNQGLKGKWAQHHFMIYTLTHHALGWHLSVSWMLDVWLVQDFGYAWRQSLTPWSHPQNLIGFILRSHAPSNLSCTLGISLNILLRNYQIKVE